MEIYPYLACWEDDIPAFVLRQCKSCRSFPLYLNININKNPHGGGGSVANLYNVYYINQKHTKFK